MTPIQVPIKTLVVPNGVGTRPPLPCGWLEDWPGTKNSALFAIRSYLGVALGGLWLGDTVGIGTALLELWV
jgi:hypothetical protein